MLVTQDVFLSTWGGEFNPPRAEFWPETIHNVKARHPDFLMLAKSIGILNSICSNRASTIPTTNASMIDWSAAMRTQSERHLARFTENHDEERALEVFGLRRAKAAAMVALTVPGLRLLHEGQIEGRRLRQPVAALPPEP